MGMKIARILANKSLCLGNDARGIFYGWLFKNRMWSICSISATTQLSSSRYSIHYRIVSRPLVLSVTLSA